MLFRAAFTLLLALALAAASPGWVAGVHAQPTRADLEAAEERLFEIESEFSMAVEAYHQASEEHAALVVEIGALREDIAELTRDMDGQADEVAHVVRSLYQGSSIRGVGLLLDSREVHELHRRAGYLQSAQQLQQGVLERFAADRRVLHGEVAELEAAEERAAALDAQLAGQADEIEARLATQRSEVAALTATIERLERERAQRQAAERAAREAAARAAAEEAAREAARERAASAPPAREVAERADRTSRDRQPEPAPQPQAAPDPGDEAGAETETEPEPEPEPQPQPAQSAAPEPSSAAHAAVEAARSQLGKPYRWGGSGPDAYDCSGLTSWAWAQAGVSIPRSSGAQYAGQPKVDRANLRPGDLVFFGSPIHHVGIYAGGGQMIEAPFSGQSVRYRSIDRRDYVGAARPG